MSARRCKVTLVVPPSLVPPAEDEVDYIGVGYLSSSLRSHGYKATIVDCAYARLDHRACVDYVRKTDPGLVGITAPFVLDLVSAVMVARRLRECGYGGFIVIGGQAASHSWGKMLDKHLEINAVCIGEGEQVIVRLARAIENGESVACIPGLATRGEWGVMLRQPQSPMDIDSITFPDRDNFLTNGRPSTLLRAERQGGQWFYPVVGSRGCPFSCAYCSVQAFYRLSPGPAWRGRSPENIVEEIISLQRTWGAKGFYFCDDNFFGSSEKGRLRAQKLAELLIALKKPIQFVFECRVTDVDEEVFARLKQAGLLRVALGIETGIPRMLNSFNKYATVEDNVRALETLQKLGVKVHPNFMFCDPETTMDEVGQLIDFLKKTQLYRRRAGLKVVFGNKLMLLAGTPSYGYYYSRGITRPYKVPGLTSDEQRICDDLCGILGYDFIDPLFGSFYRVLMNAIRRLLDLEERLSGVPATLETLRIRDSLGIIGFRMLQRLWSEVKSGKEPESVIPDLEGLIGEAYRNAGYQESAAESCSRSRSLAADIPKSLTGPQT